MSRIVFDTSVILPDYRLRRPTFRAVLVAAREVGDSLAVPAVVFDEVVNKFAEEITDTMKELRKAEARLSNVLEEPLDTFECEPSEESARYCAWLRKKLKDSNIDVLDYPDVDHRHVVNRSLERRKPFTGNGQRDYRDALIWETLLVERRRHQDDLFFVSNNASDFADPKDKQLLHPDLAQDLSSVAPGRAQVSLFESFTDVLSRGLGPRQEIVPELKEQIGNGKLGTLDLRPWLQAELPSLIGRSRVIWAGRPGNRHLEAWSVQDLQFVRAPQLLSTNNLTSRSIFLVMALIVRANVVGCRSFGTAENSVV